jgi:hypothetical protein
MTIKTKVNDSKGIHYIKPYIAVNIKYLNNSIILVT